jgi:hypothetical protein
MSHIRSLHPVVERLLRQAGAEAESGGPAAPHVFLHAPETWVVQQLVVDGPEQTRSSLEQAAQTGDLQGADAFVCVAAPSDLTRLAASLDVAADVGAAGGELAFVAGSRDGERLCGTASAGLDWAPALSSARDLDAISHRLALLLLEHPHSP